MILQVKSFGERKPGFGLTGAAGLLAVVFLAGCAHQPGVFRLATPGNAPVLAPPGAKDAATTRGTIALLTHLPRKAICSPSPHGLFVERRFLAAPRVVVTHDALAVTPASELYSWVVSLEEEGCVPPNGAFRLAENVIDAVPLDLNKRRQLVQGRTDLRSVNSLSVVSPVLKAGATGSIAEVQSVAAGANPGSIDIEVKQNPAVTGYETDWYDVKPQGAGPGYRIEPRSAEIHAGDKVERPAAPSVDRFGFGPDARWYELYMMTKVSSNDFDFVVASARTSAELQKHSADFQRDAAAFLRSADPGSYTVLPHGSGINAFIRVKVNDVAIDLPRGNTVQQAIGHSLPDVRSALPRLKVMKLHDGKLYPVEWDRKADGILALPLEGGEEISW